MSFDGLQSHISITDWDAWEALAMTQADLNVTIGDYYVRFDSMLQNTDTTVSSYFIKDTGVLLDRNMQTSHIEGDHFLIISSLKGLYVANLSFTETCLGYPLPNSSAQESTGYLAIEEAIGLVLALTLVEVVGENIDYQGPENLVGIPEFD